MYNFSGMIRNTNYTITSTQDQCNS